MWWGWTRTLTHWTSQSGTPLSVCLWSKVQDLRLNVQDFLWTETLGRHSANLFKAVSEIRSKKQCIQKNGSAFLIRNSFFLIFQGNFNFYKISKKIHFGRNSKMFNKLKKVRKIGHNFCVYPSANFVSRVFLGQKVKNLQKNCLFGGFSRAKNPVWRQQNPSLLPLMEANKKFRIFQNRDLKLLYGKFAQVLLPAKSQQNVLADWDLWGPLFICVTLSL